MFSKPLFKQSCKANGLMWAIVTAMVCFMLACVMVISGSGNVNTVASGVTDTIVTRSIEGEAKKRALSYYGYSLTGEAAFDGYFSDDFIGEYTTAKTYYVNVASWANGVGKNLLGGPNLKANIGDLPSPADSSSEPSKTLHDDFYAWINKQPELTSYDLTSGSGLASYQSDCSSWSEEMPASSLVASLSVAPAYTSALSSLSDYCLSLARKSDPIATKETVPYTEIYGSVIVSIDPANKADSYYSDNGLAIPEAYDVASLVSHVVFDDISAYLASDERIGYRQSRGQNGASVFLGDLFQEDSVKDSLRSALSDYGISADRYDSYGYDFDKVNDLSNSAIASYQARYDYEIGKINDKNDKGEYASVSEYQKAITDMDEALRSDLGSSFLSSLPSDVSSALEEVGRMDVYSLIVGSVYFKMAGLLLPIIYVIMAANNLVSSQVDSGSMAYVLSTGSKRSSVTFTQALYLILSILAMCLATMVTSFICFSAVTVSKTSMSYGSLALMNLGSFAVLFAIAGLNFFTSCYFDRQKRSMSIGGGLSIFSLVATMLGLFGSEQIPSVVRFSSLNYFNYVSIISLFDVPSIVDGTTAWMWKMAILLAFGLVGFFFGSARFKKKDLPL